MIDITVEAIPQVQSAKIKISLSGDISDYGRGIDILEWQLTRGLAAAYISLYVQQTRINVPQEVPDSELLQYQYIIPLKPIYNTFIGHETDVTIESTITFDLYPLRSSGDYDLSYNGTIRFYSASTRELVGVPITGGTIHFATPANSIGIVDNYNLGIDDASKGINAKYIWSHLKPQGWTRSAVAGILACMDCSADMNPVYQLYNVPAITNPLNRVPFTLYGVDGAEESDLQGITNYNTLMRAYNYGLRQFATHPYLRTDTYYPYEQSTYIGGLLPVSSRYIDLSLNETLLGDDYGTGLFNLERLCTVLTRYYIYLSWTRQTDPYTGERITNVNSYGKHTFRYPETAANMWWEGLKAPYYRYFIKNQTCLTIKARYWYDFLEEPAPTKRRKMPLWEKLKWSV